MRRIHLSRGFTLVEVLVTIGVIILVVSLSIPMVSAAKRQAYRARAAHDIAALSQALENYRDDMGFYPSVTCTNGSQGASVGDGTDGTLYQALFEPVCSPDGHTCGPYVAEGAFTLYHVTGSNANGNTIVYDHNNKPIVYLNAHMGANIAAPPGNVWDPYWMQYFPLLGSANNQFPPGTPDGPCGQFAEFVGNPLWRLPHGSWGNLTDRGPGRYYGANWASGSPTASDMSFTDWRYVLGDRYGWNPTPTLSMQDGTCNPANGDTPATTGPYLLMCSGPSKSSQDYNLQGCHYGLVRDDDQKIMYSGGKPYCDDIFNFTFQP